MKNKIITILAIVALCFEVFLSPIYKHTVFSAAEEYDDYEQEDELNENQILEEIGIKVFDEDYDETNQQEVIEESKTEVEVKSSDAKNTISSMTEYKELINIGIVIPDVEFDTIVTREKAAFYVALLSNKPYDSLKEETYYKDVVLSNKYIQYINLCLLSGYMSGRGDGFFYPAENISITDFIVAILRLANYEQFAQIRGGYQKGYIDLAKEYKLLKGVNSVISEELTNQDAVLIMYNALSLPVCKMSGIKEGNIQYSTDYDHLISNEYFDIERKRGVVCATHDAALYGYSACNTDAIIINDGTNIFTIRCLNNSYEKYLGADVYYYTNKDGDLINISYCSKPVIIDVDFFDIDYMSLDRKIVKYVNDSGNSKRISINSDAIFLFNGKQYNGIIPDDLQKENTYSEFVDIDSDGRFDLVFVWCAEVIVAERIPNPANTWNVNFKDSRYENDMPQYPQEAYEEWKEEESYTSFSVSEWTTGKTYDLNNNSSDYRLYMYLDDEIISYHDILANDLISIYESKDKEKRIVQVSRNSRKCIIGNIMTDTRKIELDEEEYIYSFEINDLQRLYKKEATVYFDQRGVAAAYRLSSKSEPEYGYLLDFKIRRKDEVGIAKIYTMDKKIVKLELEEKFRCNDKKTVLDDVKTHFDLTNHQLIKYVLNENGKISKLYFSTDIIPGDPIAMNTPGYTLNKEKPVFILNEHYNGASGKYGKYNSKTIEMEYNTSVATKLVVVVDTAGNIVDDLVYIVKSYSPDKTPDVKVYDASAGKIASFMVLTVTEADYNTYIASQNLRLVVGKKYETIDGTVIEGLNGNYLLRFYENEKNDFDGLKKGDVIRVQWYTEDEMGHYIIMKYQKLFTTESTATEDKSVTICADDATYSPTNLPITDGTNSYSKQIYGTIKSISPLDTTEDIHTEKYVMTIQPYGTSALIDRYVVSYDRVGAQIKVVPLLFETSTKQLSRAEPSQVTVGSKVFVVTTNYAISMIVIYR